VASAKALAATTRTKRRRYPAMRESVTLLNICLAEVTSAGLAVIAPIKHRIVLERHAGSGTC
jgi:hypothetical protein